MQPPLRKLHRGTTTTTHKVLNNCNCCFAGFLLCNFSLVCKQCNYGVMFTCLPHGVCVSSKQDMIEILKDYGKQNLTIKSVARVLG